MDFEPGRDEEKTGATDAKPEGLADEPMLWCPVCSSRLTPHKCKLVCEKCGYYMSCADYY
jgi:Zn finger protein HypA/HybF involved in hydrogenase expression